MIEFSESSSHKSTMITAKLDVDGKEAPFLTTSYNAVASADKVTATFVDENGTLLGRSVVISGDVPVYAGEALDASKAWLVDNVVYGALPTITSNTTFKVVSPMVLAAQYDIDLSQDVSSWSVPEITEDTITAVKVGTNEVTFTQNGSNIVVDNYDAITAGEYVMTLVGEKGVYVANMAVATKVIYTAADWMQVGVRTASNPDMVGYYTLGADLDFTGIDYVQDTNLYWGSTNGLKGTFNGRNHSINNLVMGTDNNSFFGTVCIGSVVKNVEINATIAWGSVGVISNLMYGTAQNVSVNLTTNGGWWNGAIARFLRSEARVDHCIIKVDGVASAADFRGAISSLVQEASVITNTYVISENFPLGYMGPDSPGAELTETATFKKYANVQAMANANVDLTSWDVTIWDVSAGYPTFKKTVKSNVSITKSYDVDLSKDSTTWTIPELANEKLLTVSVGANNVAFTQNGSTITVSDYNAILAGEYVMTLVGTNANYNVNMAVATKVIYTAAEWMQVGVRTASNPDMVGYYTLGADIDFTGIEYVQDTSAYWGSTNGLKGTFNGRNHSINNLVMGTDNNSFFGTVCIGSVVKNVEINATIAWGAVGVISNLMYGTAQNVSVNLTTNGGWWNGAIARFLRSEARVDHCMIKVDGVASAADFRGAISSLVQDASVITNTYVISENFPLGYMGPDSPGAELTETATFKKYANVQAMANANVDLSSWDATVWDVTNGYPVFKKEVA